ncbi:MAG: hypothetical protein EHM47_04230 [Ignavibacteriales bacterium]|nr:MAG: hypothetical protein EHM47_04230 [Ignavibacteriales bacterium]
MPKLTKKYFENIFRNSDSPDELFDTFRIAIEQQVKDSNLYRTLLWNRALTSDEVMMFAEKICKDNPELCYQIYSWVGKIFSSIFVYGELNDKALVYYKKAAKSNPSAHEPYIAIAKFYNPELNTPAFDSVIETLKNGIGQVNSKSKLCFSLSKLYKNKGYIDDAKQYQKMGERYQREGR